MEKYQQYRQHNLCNKTAQQTLNGGTQAMHVAASEGHVCLVACPMPGADPGILKGWGGGGGPAEFSSKGGEGSGGIFFKRGGSNHLLGSNLYCK